MKKRLPSLDHPEAQEKLAKIKMLALDVDSILTDASIFWLKDQGWTRFWSVRDGHGLLMLAHGGLPTAFITAGDSPDVRARAERLMIKRAYFGVRDKFKVFEEILVTEGLDASQVAYMGDELMDLPVLRKAGFSATVPEAVPEVLETVDYVTKLPGGKGAVREIVDALRDIHKIGYTPHAY